MYLFETLVAGPGSSVSLSGLFKVSESTLLFLKFLFHVEHLLTRFVDFFTYNLNLDVAWTLLLDDTSQLGLLGLQTEELGLYFVLHRLKFRLELDLLFKVLLELLPL